MFSNFRRGVYYDEFNNDIFVFDDIDGIGFEPIHIENLVSELNGGFYFDVDRCGLRLVNGCVFENFSLCLGCWVCVRVLFSLLRPIIL